MWRQSITRRRLAGRPGRARPRTHAARASLQPLAVQPHLQPVADQARRGAVQHAGTVNSAVLADPRIDLLEVGRAARRQRPQLGALDANARGHARVRRAHHRRDELPVRPSRRSRVPAQQQRLVERALEVPWRDSIAPFSWLTPRLLRLGPHAVVIAQLAVAPGQSSCSDRLLKAADRLSVRCSSGTPPAIHSAFCSPLTAPRSSRRPAPPRHAASRSRPARTGTAGAAAPTPPTEPQFGRDGEVRQRQASRRVLLREEDLALGALSARHWRTRRCRVRSTRRRSARDGDAAVPPAPSPPSGPVPLEHRHHLGLPDGVQRIGCACASARRTLRWQLIGFERRAGSLMPVLAAAASWVNCRAVVCTWSFADP